jgi:hypothetical protein
VVNFFDHFVLDESFGLSFYFDGQAIGRCQGKAHFPAPIMTTQHELEPEQGFSESIFGAEPWRQEVRSDNEAHTGWASAYPVALGIWVSMNRAREGQRTIKRSITKIYTNNFFTRCIIAIIATFQSTFHRHEWAIT